MYERPQYLTPDGYRRLRKNPVAKKVDPQKKKGASADTTNPLLQRKIPKSGIREISPEAAKLIAQALRGMLHDK